MTEYLGQVEIPEISASGTFPFTPDYGYGYAQAPGVAIHQFGSGNAKIEQRFYLGDGAKRFTVRRAFLTETDRIALRDFWEGCHGPYGAFTYNAPNDNGIGTTAYTVRFADEALSWELLTDYLSSVGVTLIEIPSSSPTYTLNATLDRFPSSALESALLSQTQQIIPLIKIQPKETGYPAIYVSDRRCTIGSQLYQARLLDFDGISQSIGGESDEARFVFGNADRVMRNLVNDVDLNRASLEFALFHVGTGIKLNLWKGEVVSWNMDSGPEFQLVAADGIYELTLPYPCRRISRTCWKVFDDGNGCPFAAQGSMDYTHFPDADDETCDKSYDSANGCLAHGMKRYFGGILCKPQTARAGYFLNRRTVQSQVSDSVYEMVIPEIYCANPSYVDEDGDTKYGMPVAALVASGRDEQDEYQALGIVGEGPVVFRTGAGHTLDDMAAVSGGARAVEGNDPAGSTDYFSLSMDGNHTWGDWRKVYSGGRTYDDNFAAGTAFLVMRRDDDDGIQLSKAGDHKMEAIVTYGLYGWVWTASGSRSWSTLSNPVWIVVNMLLKALGLRYASASTAEQYFDIDAAIAAAAICSQSVTKIVGTGSEIQFTFQGIMRDEKPLRDWIQDVLMNCLGYYSWKFGKLKIGIRCNSSVEEAFTEGNILFGSLRLAPSRPSFNHLTAYFKDQEYRFVANSVAIYDIDHAKLVGGATAPVYNKAQMDLTGATGKSQVARIITTRLREELGGITATQWAAARDISLNTTILALAVEPGMVCSLTHSDMPAGVLEGEPEPNYGEFRVTGWKLNKDYSIEVTGKTTVNEMYDLTVGPKPADVVADPVPVEAEISESPFGPLYDAASDNRLTPVEKKFYRLEFESIVNQKPELDTKADFWEITTEKEDYDQAFQDLADYLNEGLEWEAGVPSLLGAYSSLFDGSWYYDGSGYYDGGEPILVSSDINGAEFRGYWNAFYLARTILENKLIQEEYDGSLITEGSIPAGALGEDSVASENIAPENVEQGHMAVGAVSADRGDPSSIDFNTLTDDGAWHDLDLSAIVPVGYRMVLLRFIGGSTRSGAQFYVRKNGATNNINADSVETNGVEAIRCSFLVACDANRVIEYWATEDGWTVMALTVAAYWP